MRVENHHRTRERHACQVAHHPASRMSRHTCGVRKAMRSYPSPRVGYQSMNVDIAECAECKIENCMRVDKRPAQGVYRSRPSGEFDKPSHDPNRRISPPQQTSVACNTTNSIRSHPNSGRIRGTVAYKAARPTHRTPTPRRVEQGTIRVAIIINAKCDWYRRCPNLGRFLLLGLKKRIASTSMPNGSSPHH